MGWNESDDDRDRGRKKPGSWGGPGRGDGPPDLEEVLGKFVDALARLLGLKAGQKKGTGNSGRQSSAGDNLPFPVWWLGLALLVSWLTYDMSHFIDQRERGVVLRFGTHTATLGPGLSIRLPRPLEEVLRVNVSQVRSVSHTTAMLTRDENIIEVAVVVQWRIGDPEDYLFNVAAPDETLRQVIESVVREVTGKNELDFIYTTGRNEIAGKQQEIIQDTLDKYRAGILILGVEIQSAHPPDAVKVAFDDVIKASEDRERLINEAEAYRNDIIPKARGAAVRLREESNAYKARVIARSEGEASRFEQLLTEYQRAPEVTRQRLYLDAMENVLSDSTKVLINSEGGGDSLMYLPLDKIIEQRQRSNRGKGAAIDLDDLQSPIPGTARDARGSGMEDVPARLGRKARERR